MKLIEKAIWLRLSLNFSHKVFILYNIGREISEILLVTISA